MSLTLNDFRSVLGKVNDGNVVMKRDQSGIEKANYGGFFANLFTKVRKAPSNPEENMQIRKALLSAIQSSAEGKVLTMDQMDRIYAALGMPDGIDADKFSAPLTRRELKAVLDIVDGATVDDALVEKDIAALDSENLLNGNVSSGVKAAMAGARCLAPSASVKDGVAAARRLFGADFLGRSPAEVEKFVRLNMAVIREQVFDKLYWSSSALVDFVDEMDDVNAHVQEINDANIVPVSEEKVTAAFKEVVGSLMEKFAAGERITTRVETMVPNVEEAKFDDQQAQDVWTRVIHGDDLEFLVAKAFETTAEASGPFAAVQLRQASQAVKNMLRTTFSTLLVEHKSNTQETERAFEAKTGALQKVLKEVVADLEAIGPEEAGKVLAKVADRLGAIVVEKDIPGHKSAIADAAVKALDDVVKTFSARHLVEDFVNEQFSYLEDRKPVVDFFMAKIVDAGKEGGITGDQRTVLTEFQRAAIDGNPGDAVRQNLRLRLMTPLATAYNEKLALEDPATVRALRQTRNDKAFEALAQAQPGYANLDEAGKAEAILKMKLETLLAKVGHAGAFALGVTANAGSESIKRVHADGIAQQDPDPAAVEALEAQLLAMDDREFEFFSQYAAKGMRSADNELGNFIAGLLREDNPPVVFRDSLKDGTISVSSIPTNAVPVLRELVEAQVFANSAMNGGMADVISLRQCLPKGDRSGQLSTAVFARIRERVVAAGVKSFPDSLAAPAPGESANSIALRIKQSADRGFGKIPGFGTMDVGRILKLLSDMGVDLSPLDGDDVNAKVEVYEKILCLSTIAAMSAFKLDGLAEFTERVFGKKFEEVNYADVLKVLSKNELVKGGRVRSNIVIPDPLDKLTGAQKTAKELFAGELALAGAELPPEETSALLSAARDLAGTALGEVKSADVVIKGVSVKLTRLEGGELSVSVGTVPMRASFDAHGLVRMLENEITSKPSSFPADIVKSTLPTIDAVKSGAVPLVRARELYAKTAAAKTGLLPVMFSSYTTEQLRDIAVKAVDGTFTAADLPKVPPSSYNSGAMLEMHANLSLTSAAEIDAKVKIAAPETKSIELRRTVAPDEQTVRNVIADLFLNKDTWEFDAGKAPGERIRKLLVENEPELSFILRQLDDGLGFLSALPEQLREPVKGVLREIAKLDFAALRNPGALGAGDRNALAAIEAKVDAVADAVVNGMQDKVSALFAPKADAQGAKPDWQKTLAELTGKEGIDETTKQGAFTMKVLRNYFKNSAGVDKRAMLSAFIRNTDDASSDAKQVAELLKGAGPLLQKMLQGLPLSSFSPETQIALKDMKSRLLPIPDEAVKAQMLELVNSSNGNILSIEVKKSLGAATVGQAFLCVIKTKEHPFIGEECVVKLLRPNVDTAIRREKAMIDQLIADDPAMKATFDGQYRKILEEFDLTLESTNVGIGTKIYEVPGGVGTLHSMQMLDGTVSTMTSMIVKKAEGSTFDGAIERALREKDELLEPIKHTTNVGGKDKTVYKANDPTQMALVRRTLLAKAAYLNDRRNHILDVTKAWFENALFGNGFFHGDLHGGNLMTGIGGTTFIDFGNCSRLNSDEQAAIKMMLATIVSGDADHVISNFKKLLTGEAKAAFEAKFPDGSPQLADLSGILKRGNAFDLMSRLQAFVATVQGADVAIPASLQNFVQSYMRLADIVSDIDRAVDDLQIAAASVYCETADLAPAEGEPKVLANVKAIARAYVGDADTPYSADAVRQAARSAVKYLGTAEGKEELRSLSHDVDKIVNVLKPFGDAMYRAMKCFFNRDIAPGEARMFPILGLGTLRNDVETVIRLRDQGKIPSKEADEAFGKVESALRELAGSAETYYIQSMSFDDGEESTFDDVAMKRDKSMTDICTDVIGSHQLELGLAALGEFGLMGISGFKSRLGSEFEVAEKAVTRAKNVGPVIVKRNGELPPGERLGGAELATLLRATGNFFTPSPRPDAKAGWGATPANRAKMLESIAYSLKRGADALKVEHMTDAAVRHAALNFGLSDGKLAMSITEMSDADYNTLLAEAQQLDAQNGGHELAIALEALRGSQVLFADVRGNA